MSRKVVIVGLLVLWMVGGAGAHREWSPYTNVRPAYQWFLDDGDVVVFYGDSITAQKKYGQMVEKEFRAVCDNYNWKPDITFHILGFGGKTAPWGQKHIEKVLDLKPTVVTLLWGMNDAAGLSVPGVVRSARYREALTAQVRSFQEAGVRVVILTVTPVDEKRTKSRNNRVLSAYARIAQQVALATGAELIDVRKAFVRGAGRTTPDVGAGKAKVLIPDGVHPNAAGHRIIADAILDGWNIPR